MCKCKRNYNAKTIVYVRKIICCFARKVKQLWIFAVWKEVVEQVVLVDADCKF